MKKIKIILPFSIIVFIIFFNFLNLYKSKLDIANEIRGTIVSKNGNSFILKSREKILFYSKNNYQVGDIVIINGEMTKTIKNTNFNLFNYQNYLKSKKIYWIMYSENDYKIGENKFYKINKNNCNPYIKALIFGDTSSIEDDIKDSYQKNGISHLFAISGMHITLMTSIIYFIIKKIINNKFIDNIIISLFLFFYMFITCFSISVIRASIMFIILNFTKLKSNYVILIVFLVFLLYI